MTIYMYIASVAWFLLVIGFFLRRSRAFHIGFMLAGIWLDVALVFYLQATRGAVQKALEFSLGVLPQVHIVVSTLALLLYFPVMFLGFSLIKGRARHNTRALHARMGLAALVLRTLGFFFMFSMMQPR